MEIQIDYISRVKKKGALVAVFDVWLGPILTRGWLLLKHEDRWWVKAPAHKEVTKSGNLRKYRVVVVPDEMRSEIIEKAKEAFLDEFGE